MGMGCDEYGVCYAAAHGEPDRCGYVNYNNKLPCLTDDPRWANVPMNSIRLRTINENRK